MKNKLNTLLIGMFSSIILTASSLHVPVNADEVQKLAAIEMIETTYLEEFVWQHGNQMVHNFSQMLDGEQAIDIEVKDGNHLILTFMNQDANDKPDLTFIKQNLQPMAVEIKDELLLEELNITLRFIGKTGKISGELSWRS